MSWARAHERCASCGTTEKPHKGRGMCVPCYFGERYRTVPGLKESMLEAAKQWREKNKPAPKPPPELLRVIRRGDVFALRPDGEKLTKMFVWDANGGTVEFRSYHDNDCPPVVFNVPVADVIAMRRRAENPIGTVVYVRPEEGAA